MYFAFIEFRKAIEHGNSKEIEDALSKLSSFDRFVVRVKGHNLWKIGLEKRSVFILKALHSAGFPYIQFRPPKVPTSAEDRKFVSEYALFSREVENKVSALINKMINSRGAAYNQAAKEYEAINSLGTPKQFIGYTIGSFSPATVLFLFDVFCMDYDIVRNDKAFLDKFPIISKEIDLDDLTPGEKVFPSITFDPDSTESSGSRATYSNLVPLAFLGSGSFGAVFVVRVKNYGKVIVKIPTPDWEEVLQQECDILKEVGCESPYVLCVRECTKGTNTAIFSDYYKGYFDGWRWKVCASEMWENASYPNLLASIIKQLLIGLAHIHSKGVAHRDLWPANFLIKVDSGRVIIIDFGLAYDGSEDPSLEGMRECIPIEVYEKLVASSSKTNYLELFQKQDIYAIGCILYMFCNFTYPYGQFPPSLLRATNKAVTEYKWMKQLNPPLPLNLPIFQPLFDMLCGPLDTQPTISQAIEEVSRIIEKT